MNNTSTNGKVYLIGAGPGEAKLLTIKAAEAIAASDVLVYDYLVNPEVLAYSRRGAELVYVGKRAAAPSISQAEINHLLIERARQGQIVARLKGGDPFIFGRGGEEAEALVEAGIEWQVIPGISAGVAAAAYAGIPLTHRGYASSVAFITGHDSRKSRSDVDWHQAAHFADTLVIFMCAETIRDIARALIEGGRKSSTPIAIIRWGTYEDQQVFAGTLEDLADENEAHETLDIRPPAIAIVGEVVLLKDKLNWFKHQAFELGAHALLNR
ncbi:MAG: uroporphyrinogen-III C-methyltransferase [Acidobacteria bacterium]|nr:uroporphyrinogen-III C-methyltransferase [Acidobacteriota bacterium]